MFSHHNPACFPGEDAPGALVALLSAHDEPDGWRQIDTSLLEDYRPSVPAIPLNCLPSSWRGWVSDAANSAGAPADYVVQAVLAAVAGLSGTGVRVCIGPTWSEPLVLWQALVGAASTGKTPALGTVSRPLAAVQKLLSRSDGAGAARPEQGKGAVVVRDAALPALERAVAARASGVLLWRDEATPWLKSLMREAGNDKSGGRWLEAWSGSDNLAVSIIGSLHPGRVAEQLPANAESVSARFLFTWPSLSLRPSAHDGRAIREPEAAAWLQRISAIVGSPDSPLLLGFDEEALKFFDRFFTSVTVDMRAAEGVEAAWLGKGRGTVARLSGILALLDWSQLPATAPPRTVTRDQVEAAGRLWRDYFRLHARAVLDLGAPSNFDRQARRVIRWLKEVGKSAITRTEVRVQALGKTVNASRTQLLLRHLHDAGIVRPASYPMPPQGGRPPQVWEVNPTLLTSM